MWILVSFMPSPNQIVATLPTLRNSDATGLLNKADGKNRESENLEEISLLNGRSPHGCARTPAGALRNREPAEREGGGTSVCEYGRNGKIPKGLPHGVLR